MAIFYLIYDSQYAGHNSRFDLLIRAAVLLLIFLVIAMMSVLGFKATLKKQAGPGQKPRNITTSGPAAAPLTENNLGMPLAEPVGLEPVSPNTADGTGTAEADVKDKLESAKMEIDLLRSAGVDVSTAEKLLQIAISNLNSGHVDRAAKYADKASKLAEDSKQKAEGVTSAAEATDAGVEKEEVASLISAVQAKLANLRQESAARTEAVNLLRLAGSFVRSRSYAKALRYARQADEMADALIKSRP